MHEQRPVYHIAAAGLDPRDIRLIELVFQHSEYNRFEFVLHPGIEPELIDVLLANEIDPRGMRAMARVRALGRHVPVVAALPPGACSALRHSVPIERITLQLLPVLNRVVEAELLSGETQALFTAADLARAGEVRQPLRRNVPPGAAGRTSSTAAAALAAPLGMSAAVDDPALRGQPALLISRVGSRLVKCFARASGLTRSRRSALSEHDVGADRPD